MAHIQSIVVQPASSPRQTKRFLRRAVSSARLIAGHGIEGDAKAGRHPDRQLNLISSTWLAEQARAGFATAPGDFGEQIVVDGLTVEALSPGDCLLLGEEAVIQLCKARPSCAKVTAVHGRSPATVGMLARVLHDGVVTVGDPIRQILPVPD